MKKTISIVLSLALVLCTLAAQFSTNVSAATTYKVLDNILKHCFLNCFNFLIPKQGTLRLFGAFFVYYADFVQKLQCANATFDIVFLVFIV